MPEYASWPRRIAALMVDWLLASLITVGILGPEGYVDDPRSSWVVLGVFAVEVAVLTALAGGSFGQVVTRIRVMRTDGRPISLLAAVLRTVLICLVIPPLVFKPNGRGLHDLATGSAAYVRERVPAP